VTPERRQTHAGQEDHARTVVTYEINEPLDEAVVDAAVAVAKAPVVLVRRAAPVAHGLPVYLGIGGLAAFGVIEWPVAAATAVGFAALRRWGPLRTALGG
jgi:hypothetical protein